ERLCGRLELRRLWRRGVPDPPESPLPRARDCRSRVLRLVRDRRVETLPRADRAILAADPGRDNAGSGGAVLLRDAAALRDPAGFRTPPASHASVVHDAVDWAPDRCRAQSESHPEGVYAVVRPAPVRISAGSIPVP